MRPWALVALAVLMFACDDDDPDAVVDGAPMADAAPDVDLPPADMAPGPDAGPDAGPDMDPPPSYDTLSAPVEVVTDENGLKHIYAENDLDLFFAAGYEQAVDRLFAIDMARRQGTGRLAEVFGDDGVSGDLQARVFGFHRLGQRVLAGLRETYPAEHDFFVAFAGGVNRRIAEIAAGEAPMPPEYAALGFEPEPITPAESLAIGIRITFGFSSTLEFDLLFSLVGALAPGAVEVPVFQPVGDAFVMREVPLEKARPLDLPAESARIDPEQARGIVEFFRRWRHDLDMGDGSNCWVINGDFTDNGRPILANDSHATLLDPNVMYPVHLSSAHADGTWDAIGMAFTGVPGVQVGHNRHVAWGATTHFADMLDLWDVRIEDGEALVGDERVPVEEVVETFRIREDDGTFRERSITVRHVPGHGRIVPPEMLAGIPVGLVVRGELMAGWPGFEAPNVDAKSYFDMARADSIEAWADAVRLQSVGMQNWMGADASGMRYVTSGLVPDRGPLEGRSTPNRIMDASDPSTLWTRGFFPAERLPYRDGSAPFMHSANNDPWGHTADNDPLNDEFYYGSFYSPGFRAARLNDVLPPMLAAGPHTMAESKALQVEIHSPWAERMIALLDEAITRLDAGDEALADFAGRDDLRAAHARLQGWDRDMSMDSREATLFRIWAEYAARSVLADDLNILLDAIAEEEPVYMAKLSLLSLEEPIDSLVDGDRSVLLLAALDEALVVFAERGEPTWGEVHRAVFRAPDRTERVLATPGGDTSLNVAQSLCWQDGGFAETCRTTAGAVYRFVTGFDDDGTPVSDFMCPSCLPETDAPWTDGAFVRLPFRRADVEAATATTHVLE